MIDHVIDGDRVAAGGATRSVRSPATGRVVAEVPVAGAVEVELAVRAAARAGATWSAAGAAIRAELVRAGVERALAASDALTRAQCEEMGQPWSVCRPLTEQALRAFADSMAEAIHYPFRVTVHDDGDRRTEVLRVPYGVAGLITPWNVPLPVSVGGLASLLAGGNTVVWKPSEVCPSFASMLAELLDLPAGVLNVVHGDAGTGRLLAEHDGVGIVVFTGSPEAGAAVARASAERCRPMLLELAGKDPVVVDRGVDPVWAAQVVATGAFWNSGQVCASMERIYVHAEIADEFFDALVRAAEGMVVGDPCDPSTQLGPLATADGVERAQRHVADAVARGARVLTGGAVADPGRRYFPPTVLADVTDDMLAMTEETFGPLAPVRVVASFDEGLALAARSDYALGATILTADPEHAERGREIPAAICWINEWQGGAPGMVYEPTRRSGVGTVGTLDSTTRAFTLHRAPAGDAAPSPFPADPSAPEPSPTPPDQEEGP